MARTSPSRPAAWTACHCEETLKLIAEGKLDTEPLITHTYPLSRIEEAYELFEKKQDGVIKVAVEC